MNITTAKRVFYVTVVLLILPAVAGYCSQVSDTTQSPELKKHQGGIRLGVWSSRGETIPESDTAGTFVTNINKNNFFIEGFYGYRLFSPLGLEFSLAMVNRGSVTFEEAGTSNVGNLLIYSFLLHAKLYPLASLKTKLQPFVSLGGGVYYGRRSVQFTNNYYYAAYNEESGTELNYAIGGGFDWRVSSSIGLETGARYMPIKFSKGLMTIRDYDALAFWVGMKYLYRSEKKKDEHKRRLR